VIQGDVSPGDMAFGAAVLAVALPVFYFIGKVIVRLKNAKFERAWRPLMPVLTGAKVVADQGGGGASSWLTGTYRGTSVFAEMTPDVGRGGLTDSPGYENRFETGVRDLAGASDWSVRWSEQFLGFGTTGWVVSSDDPVLTEKLERAGVRELVASLGRGEVRYRTFTSTLVLHQDIRPLWVPPPERFRTELDVLLELAAVAGPLNKR
jgi:hypothetical protein